MLFSHDCYEYGNWALSERITKMMTLFLVIIRLPACWDKMMKDSRSQGNLRNPCLTMHQPWASLLVYGIKRIEGRSWPAPIRGCISCWPYFIFIIIIILLHWQFILRIVSHCENCLHIAGFFYFLKFFKKYNMNFWKVGFGSMLLVRSLMKLQSRPWKTFTEKYMLWME